MLLSKSNVQ
uniref:Uncharacterized protein n=1 Tax=Anguilla anguilla TaxID=7936 RepID=A0A0E9VQP9_ANGAN